MSGYNTNLIESSAVTTGGNSLVIYPLSLHVQGAVELMQYVGGVADGYFLTGGVPASLVNTVVKLVVSDPSATYYLNRSASVPTPFSVALDYYAKIQARGGATLTLYLQRGDHTLLYQDVGGGFVKTALPPFNGEYVQLDFSSTLLYPVVEKRAGVGVCRNLVFSGYEENILGTKAEK